MTRPTSVTDLLRATSSRLAAAGIDSARAEASIIVAHVLGVDRGAPVAAEEPTPEQLRRVEDLVAARAADRIPVQYLLGTAVSGRLDLAVGPGVFIPRPETELLVADVTGSLPPVDRTPSPLVVDLCAGSGTLALEIAHARPDARVYAVEKYPQPLHWLTRNARDRRAAGDTPIRVHHGDATDPGLLPGLHGQVDAVVSNPPYIPDGTDLPSEVRDHEPAEALFGGPDGLRVITPLVEVAARLLRPGGRLVVEHDDTTQAAVAAVIDGHGGFGTLERHTDLAGRPRYITAVRAGDGDETRSPR